ncbi:hypothetical protein JCM19046_2606 [Bacillus sp. JCM 19046]|nr:hypothetical protein JCM19046_2606 [Bacillus sp. JCM 19046]
MLSQTLCFIGGGRAETGELNGIIAELKHHIPPGASACMIQFATEVEKQARWIKSATEFFRLLGVDKISVLDSRLSNSEMSAVIYEHSILYFTGGRPEMLLNQLEYFELIPVIQQFNGMLIGVSAGALAFCKDCLITKDNDYPATYILKGIGLVPFTVEVHYHEQIDDEILPHTFDRTIYGLRNGSALINRHGSVKPVGDIISFTEGEKNDFTN